MAALSKSKLREEIVSSLDDSLVLKGVLGNIVKECKVESSAYELTGLDVMDKRSWTRGRW